MEGHRGVVSLLPSVPNVNVNSAKSFRRTPLHHAAMGDRTDVNEHLMTVPNDGVNVTDNGGWKPLHHAADSGSYVSDKLLLAVPNVHTNHIEIHS